MVLKVAGVNVPPSYMYMVDNILEKAITKKVAEVISGFIENGKDLSDPAIIFDISDKAGVFYRRNSYIIDGLLEKAFK